MSNAIETYSVDERIKNILRQQIGALIPDEVLETRLKVAVADFFQDVRPSRHSDPIRNSSPFAKLVHEEVTALLRETVEEKVKAAYERAFAAVTPQEMARLIAAELFSYEQSMRERIVSQLGTNLPYTIANVVQDMKGRGQL